MNNRDVFSKEYSGGTKTEIVTRKEEPTDKNVKIDDHYSEAKPRRKIIKGTIIHDE